MRTLLASALLATLAGCGLTADLQVERACARMPTQTVQGVPVAPPGTVVTLPPVPLPPVTFGGAIPDMKKKGVTDAELLFDSLDITSQAAPGIRSLTLSVLPPAGSTLPVKAIATYTRPAGTAPRTIHATGDGSNLVDYLENGNFSLQISGQGDAGQVPPSFTIDTQLCVDAKATVDYFQAASN